MQVKDGWTINTPIQIFSNLLADNNISIAEPILYEISVDLVRYIRHYSHADASGGNSRGLTEQDEPTMNRFRSSVTNLFQIIAPEMNSVWIALGSLLSYELRQISSEYVEDAYRIEAIDLISFALSNLYPIVNDNHRQ